jgi:uncharacterized protein (DUF58 family)
MTDITALTPEQTETLTQLAETANEKLHKAGASQAELAFGIGCGLGFGPIALIVLILLIFHVINIILAFMLWLLAALALIGISTILSIQARARKTDRTYREEVQPEIENTLRALSLDRPSFDRLARQSLPPDADLQKYLSAIEIDTSPQEPV